MVKIVLLFCLLSAGCATAEKNLPEKPVTVESVKETRRQAPADPREMQSVISLFSQAIEKNPAYAGGYYNRAIAYFHVKDYEKARQDVKKAESLGLKFSPDFIAELNKASQKEN